MVGLLLRPLAGVYTKSMVFCIVGIVALMSGPKGHLNIKKFEDLSKQHNDCTNAIHETHNVDDCPFWEATTESYLNGACPPITHECNHVNLHLPVVQPNIACDSIDPTLNTPGLRKLGGEECHLWMGSVGANRVMRGVNILNEFNMSEGTAMISVPTACNIPHTMVVPISHLRPYM